MGQPGRRQPGAAVRRDRDGDVRLRPHRGVGGGRARRRHGEARLGGRARRTGLDLAGDPVQPARARPAGVRHRDRRRGARRAAHRRCRLDGDLLGQVDRSRRATGGARGAAVRRCRAAVRRRGARRRDRAVGHDLADRYVRAGRRRYPVRRPRRRDQGEGDVAPTARPPGGGAGPDWSNTSRRSGARYRPGRRSVGGLALGRPARRVCRGVGRRRIIGIRTADR